MVEHDCPGCSGLGECKICKGCRKVVAAIDERLAKNVLTRVLIHYGQLRNVLNMVECDNWGMVKAELAEHISAEHSRCPTLEEVDMLASSYVDSREPWEISVLLDDPNELKRINAWRGTNWSQDQLNICLTLAMGAFS